MTWDQMPVEDDPWMAGSADWGPADDWAGAAPGPDPAEVR